MQRAVGIPAYLSVAFAISVAMVQDVATARASSSASSGIILSVAPIPTTTNPSPGTPQVRWSTGNGSPGEVTVTPQGAKEMLFASGSDGTASAPWVTPGSVYAFRLYSLVAGRRLLALLQVGRAAPLKVLLGLPPSPRITSSVIDRLLQILSFASIALLALLAGMHIIEVRRGG